MYILVPGEVWQLDWQFMTQCNTSCRQYQLGALAKQRRWVHCSLLLELLVSKFNLNFTDFVYFDLLDCKYFIPCTKIYFSTFRNATFIAKLSDVSKLNFLDMSNVHLLIAIKICYCNYLYSFVYFCIFRMVHQPSGGARGQATDIQIQAEEIIKLKKQLNEIYVKHTKQPLDYIYQSMERDKVSCEV